jgi:hypothetical protein
VSEWSARVHELTLVGAGVNGLRLSHRKTPEATSGLCPGNEATAGRIFTAPGKS